MQESSDLELLGLEYLACMRVRDAGAFRDSKDGGTTNKRRKSVSGRHDE
jgi:hypothetical protein